MKKVIKLTEADLTRIVKRVIKESMDDNNHSDRPYYEVVNDEELREIALTKVNDIADKIGVYRQFYDIMNKIDAGNVSEDDFDSYENELGVMDRDLKFEIVYHADENGIDEQMKEMILDYAEYYIDDMRGKLHDEYRKEQKRSGNTPPKTTWSYPPGFKDNN